MRLFLACNTRTKHEPFDGYPGLSAPSDLATQPELAQQFRTTFEMVEMVMETLRTKGKVRFTKVLPACASGACSGSCAQAPKLDEGKRVPVRVYEWIGVKS